MLSIVIPHVPVNKTIDEMLDRCLVSLSGYDELVVVINDGIGYGKAFNRGFRYAKGDFILAVSNDTVLQSGDLKDMCIADSVTYSENAQWGCFFCLPRWVLKKVGGFDLRFGTAYFEDDNYLSRLSRAGIPCIRVAGIKVDHIGGVTVKAIASEKDLMNYNRTKFQEREQQLNEGASLYEPLS